MLSWNVTLSFLFFISFPTMVSFNGISFLSFLSFFQVQFTISFQSLSHFKFQSFNYLYQFFLFFQIFISFFQVSKLKFSYNAQNLAIYDIFLIFFKTELFYRLSFYLFDRIWFTLLSENY